MFTPFLFANIENSDKIILSKRLDYKEVRYSKRERKNDVDESGVVS
jgi:hypothetical protein